MKKLENLIEKKGLLLINEDFEGKLFTYKYKDFFYFLEIEDENLKYELINKKIGTIFEKVIKLNDSSQEKYKSFMKNLQCFLLFKSNNVREFNSEVLKIEDDQYYANKFVIPYEDEKDIIDYLKFSVPFFYEEEKVDGSKTGSISLDFIEEKIISGNEVLRDALNKYNPKKDNLEKFLESLEGDGEEKTIKEKTIKEKKNVVSTTKDNWYVSSLTINNFRNASYHSHKNYDEGIIYDFDEVNNGIVTLSGPNGLGKTTFFHALKRLLFGNISLESRKVTEQPECIYRNSSSADDNFFVKVIFKNDEGKELCYVREGYKSKDINESKATDKSKLMVQKYNEFDKVGDDELLCFFNVSEKEYDFFMYVPQDKPLEFIVSSKGEKEKNLSGVFGTQRYKDLEKLIGAKNQGLIKLIENEVAVSKAKLSQDMEKININFSEDPRKKVTLNKDEIESILKSLNKNIIISKENIRESINALNDINIRISTIDDRMNIEISRNYGFKYQQLEKDGILEVVRNILNDISLEDISGEAKKIDFKRELVEKKINLINNIEQGYDKIEMYDFVGLLKGDDEVSSIKKDVVTYCAICERIREQSEALFKLEKQIEGILLYVKEENSLSCPACKSKFNNHNELYSSIQDSINSLKSKLQTKERDVALEKLKRQSFLDKKTIFEEEVKALNYRKGILKRITTESKFMSDLKEEGFKKIETKKVTERGEGMYRDLNSIRSEYNLYKKINIDKLISYLGDFNQCYNYEKEKQNKETNLRIEKLKKIKNLIETYRDNIKEKRKNFENIIVNELSQYVRKYSKSIIKYNSLGDIIIQGEEGRGITIGLEGNKKGSPEFTFSQGQLAGVALSCVLAFYKKVISQKVKLRILLIDDPIQTIDDLNALNLINILRYDFSDSQVILSTHEENFDKLIRYKYQVLGKKQKGINMSNM